MGHLGYLKEEYRALVHRLDAGSVALPDPELEEARRARKEILELLFSPEDAALAARLPVLPSTVDKISKRLGVGPSELKPKLDALCDKGIVLDLIDPSTGEATYLLAPPVVGFFEFSTMRKDVAHAKLAEAVQEYAERDPAFPRELFARRTVVGRALPNEAKIADEDLPEVLDWERATSLIETAGSVAVTTCYCRHHAAHLGRDCDSPKENCLSLGHGAEYMVRHGFARKIEPAEGLDILREARARSLAQIADNVQRKPTYICNCCGCCCMQLRAISHWNLPAVTPSAFTAKCELDRCAGCSRCARACPIGAIEMEPAKMSGRPRAEMRPEIDPERCIGCGVCATACQRHAMALATREKRPSVPSDVVEKALLMAIERGKLAHLAFDEGAGRGARFLNRILTVLLSLPPAKQALASRQLQSRFVRFAMNRIHNPLK